MAHKLTYLLIIAALCLSSGVSVRETAAQTPTKSAEQDQVIKVNTELVEVRAVVTNRQGQIVSGLKQEDFELLENNKPQAISFFSLVRVAGKEKSATEQPTANQPVNRAGATKTSRERLSDTPARTVVLFVDNLHLSPGSLMQVKQALRRFIDEQLTEQDLVALVSTVGSMGLVEQLTRNRQVLRYAIDRLNPGPVQRQHLFTPYLAAQVDRDPDAMTVAIEILKTEEGLDGLPRPLQEAAVRGRANQLLSETYFQSKVTLHTLKAVAERMAGLPGQRMIVLFSDGFTLYNRGNSQETGDLQAATSRAVRSGVAIYSIDAKGLQPPAIFNTALNTRAITDPHLFSYSSASDRDLEHGLNALAKDTGGDAFFNSNDLPGSLQKALDGNSLYYTLAYYPAEEGKNKQFRRIMIRVKNHPEYQVLTPKGYLPSDLTKTAKEEAAATPEQRLMQAMHAPLSRSEISVAASADFMEGETDDAQVSLRVEIAGDKLDYPEQDQKHILGLELIMLFYDANGQRVDGKTATIQGKVRPENLALVKQNGYTYLRRIALKPGLYQARIGVRELDTERFGTTTAWVEVPNLTKSKLALSSLILLDALTQNPDIAEKQPAAPSPESSRSEPPLAKIIEGIRFYSNGQPITYFFRVYQPAQNATEGLVMQTEFIQDGKMIKQSNWQPVSERQIVNDKKGIGVGGQIQLTGLKPGIYEMRVTVKDPSSKRSAQRTVAFGIE